jgi:hypothetical protein
LSDAGLRVVLVRVGVDGGVRSECLGWVCLLLLICPGNEDESQNAAVLVVCD